jgi:type IX secretion system PorP/SprF family membrane protein
VKEKKVFIITLLFVFAILAKGQDVHFSQYYFSPLTLNPANTGNYKGDYRFFGNYRSQWRELGKAYNTFSAGGDFNAYPQNLNVSGGLLFLSDRSAENLLVTKILPAGATHVRIAGYKLHAGIMPGIVIKSIDFYRHSFPEQLNWETGRFDNTLPNSETNVRQRFVFLDLAAGVAASRFFGDFEPEIGFSLFHINLPKESFFGDNNRLKMRKAINANLNYYLTDNVVLHGHSLYGFTTRVSDWVSGINAEYILSRTAFFNNSVFAGFMFRDGIKRNPDAFILTLGFNYSHYTVGFSHDITYSQLKTAVDSKGAFEIAFIYRAKNTRLNKKILPCERY